jgi:GT2 family glycosyltransferase
MKILALIVSYNFEPWMDRCLGSLRNSSLACDILVVDNASSDQTCLRLRQEFPEVLVQENQENLGFGAANNWGLKYALSQQYDAVFLINQDAYVDELCLEILNKTSVKHPDYGIISPVHLNGKGDALDLGFKNYTGVSAVSSIPKADIVPARFINAAFWWIPLRILKTVGGFSPLFPHYGEDVDYANRVLYRGWKIGYVPGAWAYHCREDRKSSEEKLLRSEYLYFLTEAVNLTKSSPEAFAYSVLAPVKKAIMATLTGKRAGPYWKMALRVAGQNTGQYRKQSALPGAYL